MGKNKSITYKDLNPEDPATPCGLIAKTFFDGFLLLLRKKLIHIQIPMNYINHKSI